MYYVEGLDMRSFLNHASFHVHILIEDTLKIETNGLHKRIRLT